MSKHVVISPEEAELEAMFPNFSSDTYFTQPRATSGETLSEAQLTKMLQQAQKACHGKPARAVEPTSDSPITLAWEGIEHTDQIR